MEFIKIKRYLTVALVTSSLLSSVFTVSFTRGDTPIQPPAPLTAHDPIFINGNENFTEENGVTNGDGTKLNPYIISNWSINVNDGCGIQIINANAYFIIRNCLIFGENYSYSKGIDFLNVNNGKIENSTVTNNNYIGISLVSSSDNNIIYGNNIKNNSGDSISISGSNNNIIKNNILDNDDLGVGVNLYNSLNTTIIDNNFLSNGIFISGSSLNHWNTHIIDNNIANGRPIRYYKNMDGIVVPSDTSQLILANCTSFSIKNLNLSDIDVGIQLGFSSNNNLYNNKITNNHFGIYLYSSKNNIISGNPSIKNNQIGIIGYYLANDIISNNYLTNNEIIGIGIGGSENITIRNNILFSNGICLLGETTFHWNTHIIENNFANGQPIYYYKNINNTIMVPSDAAQVILANCSHFILQNLNIENVDMGIQVAYSEDNKIINCNISENYGGLYFFNACNNNVSENNFSNNIGGGSSIILIFSSNNIISSNEITNNDRCIHLQSSSNYNKINSNNINNNSHEGIYLYDGVYNDINYNIVENNNEDGINIVDSSYTNISSNYIINNFGNGICLQSGSYNNIFSNNIVNNNESGIRLWPSPHNNFIFRNNIINNSYGIHGGGSSSNNLIYHNNFINNKQNTYDNSVNIWDNGYPSGGNYWDDYSGTDSNKDGIGDIPYNIFGGNNKDFYPLMESFNDKYSQLTEGLSEIGMPDNFPCSIQILDPDVVRIVCGDEDSYSSNCSDKYYVAGEYPPVAVAKILEEGRIVGVGHEGYFFADNINSFDNLKFGQNIVKWLDVNQTGKILFDNRSLDYYWGQWVNDGLILKLEEAGYTVDILNEEASYEILKNYSVYMICTSWDTINDAEIDAIEQYVRNGGGLVLTGLGWSWIAYHPGSSLEDYPMNIIGERFGIKFLDDNLADPTNYIGDIHCPIFHIFGSFQFNVKPIVSIAQPTNGQTVTGTISVLGAASDPNGNNHLEKVQIRIDSSSWIDATGTTSWSYSWNTNSVSDGGHIIYTRAYDGIDYSFTDSVIVIVDNVDDDGNGGGPGPPPPPPPPQDPILSVYPTSDEFYMAVGETLTWNFYIENIGGGTLHWNINKNVLDTTSRNSFIKSCSPMSGSATTETDTVTAYFDTTGLEPNYNYISGIKIDTDHGDEQMIKLTAHTSGDAPVRDIAVTGLTYSPASPKEGDIIHIDTTIKNEGEKRETFTIRFYVDGIPQSSTEKTLSSGHTATYNDIFSWNAVSGAHTFKISVIPLTGEVDVSDNSLTKSINVGDGDDDIIQARINNVVFSGNEEYYQGTYCYLISDTITTKVEIENTGNVEHKFWVGYSVRNHEYSSYIYDISPKYIELLPNQKGEVNFNWVLPYGKYRYGKYDAIIKIWKEYSGGSMQGELTRWGWKSDILEIGNQLYGYVQDYNANPLEEVQVTASWGIFDSVTTYTSSLGFYQFHGLPTGETITVEASLTDGKYIKILDAVNNNNLVTKHITTSGLSESEWKNLPDLEFDSGHEIGGGLAFYLSSKTVRFYKETLELKLDHDIPEEIFLYAIIEKDGKKVEGAKHTPKGLDGCCIELTKNYSKFPKWETIYHELSHHMMLDLYESWIRNEHLGCQKWNYNHHGFNNPCTCDAIVEGWAEFMPAIIKGYQLNDPKGYHYYKEDIELNWNQLQVWNYSIKPEGARYNYGEKNDKTQAAQEFAVAGILWDIYDGLVGEEEDADLNADGDYIDSGEIHWLTDNIELSLEQMWDVFDDGDIFTVEDLYIQFMNSGIITNIQDLKNIFTAHGWNPDNKGW